MNNAINIKEEIAKLVEFIETASEEELDKALIMFNKGCDARAQGLKQESNSYKSRPDLVIWADGWIAKDYQLWLDSKLDLTDWLEKNNRDLK